MKDFLQGRPQSHSIRPTQSSEPLASQFPPISVPETIEEPSEAPVLDQATPESLADTPITEPESPTTSCAIEEPIVEAVPDAQGRISHIVVTCRCGEQTIVQCNY